ncbi:MAG: DUF2083 domain-containing protein [Rhodobacteraceae bacterium]|nr:DUF2083 domain-containing protein [Paracoccaceae bacterium]
MVRTLVGSRIRERRRALKQTQSALAQAVGISASYLNLIEHNRRGIAGRTLLALAAELEVDISELSEGADGVLVNRLTEIAKTSSEIPEIERTEEFIGRYPGWAKLLASVGKTAQSQRENLAALTDRMNHDPFLSETMHQILSNITVIRSTAGILDTTPDISDEHRTRFLKNIRTESQRLSTTAQAMVDFFDAPQTETTATPHPEDEFWVQLKHHLPELEAGITTIETLLDQQPKRTATSTSALQHSLQYYRDVARDLPLDAFHRAISSTACDPLALAQHFNTPVINVLHRLAHLPASPDTPAFGLMECDMSGAILLRKEIPEFALPQYSSACPLWPIYRAFAAPGQPIRAVLEMPTGVQVTTFSIARTITSDRYDLPPLLRSTMIFTTDPRAALPTSPPILAGLHCSVCPRKHCAERRIDYILS